MVEIILNVPLFLIICLIIAFSVAYYYDSFLKYTIYISTRTYNRLDDNEKKLYKKKKCRKCGKHIRGQYYYNKYLGEIKHGCSYKGTCNMFSK